MCVWRGRKRDNKNKKRDGEVRVERRGGERKGEEGRGCEKRARAIIFFLNPLICTTDEEENERLYVMKEM